MMPAARHRLHVQVEPAWRGRVPAARLRAAARAALRHQAAPAPGALTLRLTGDEVLQQLNRDFLGHDYATDVLSFPSSEAEAGERYFGDIAISLPRAAAQAEAGGHPLEAELQLLVVHGVLHLLGHDHATRRDRARMWAAQAEILTAVGAPITGPAPRPKTRPPRRTARR
jgi:probable rRNA maturation factor